MLQDKFLLDFLENAQRLKKYEFKIKNDRGGSIECRVKTFNYDICIYSILATGQMSKELLEDYLINYDKTVRPLRDLGYKIIGIAEVYKLTLYEGFNKKDLIALSNGIATIVQGDLLISVGFNNSKGIPATNSPKLVPNSSQLFNSLYNRYLRCIGPRVIPQNHADIASEVSDVEEARNFAQEIVGSAHIADIKSAIIALGYQLIFRLPKELILKFPRKQEDLELLFSEILQDINPNSFESRV